MEPRTTELRLARLACPVLLVALTSGCEAQTTIVTKVELPSAIAASDRTADRLRVDVQRASSFSQKLDPPGGRCPSLDPERAKPFDNAKTTPSGFEITQSAIPSVPEFCMAAWFDANENGKVDSGDAVGQLAKPYPCQPSKFFGSNRYESPAVVLTIVP